MEKLNVVIVDDNIIALESMEKLMPWAEIGCNLCGVFSCGDDALEFLKGNRVDVIITDICMPKPNGLDIADICWNKYPEIRIIMVSAYRKFEYAQKALRYGNVVDYLTKPLNYKRLTEQLSKMFSASNKNVSAFSSDNDVDMRVQFFSNILCGNVLEISEVTSELKRLGIDMDLEKTPCTMVVFHIKDFQTFLGKHEKYNSEQIYRALASLYPFSTIDGFFSLALYSYSNVVWLILHRNHNVQTAMEKFQNSMIENFSSVFNMEIEVVLCRKTTLTKLISDRGANDIKENSVADDSVIDIVNKYVHEHLNEQLSLEKVASQVFMSPVYFSAYFKDKTGKKFLDYLTSVRMEKAAELIMDEETPMSILDICDVIGYNYKGYFFKKFKEYFGVTPAQYKNARKEENKS